MEIASGEALGKSLPLCSFGEQSERGELLCPAPRSPAGTAVAQNHQEKGLPRFAAPVLLPGFACCL